MIFILGGCRSGKSVFALKLAESMKGKKAYLATGEPLDDEMTERIKRHKKERGRVWTAIEEPVNIIDVIKKNEKYDVILLDCLTLWISNLMHEKTGARGEKHAFHGQGASIEKTIEKFISVCKKTKYNLIIVSNEVGLGIVPDNPLARQFRDMAGYTNQNLAKTADEVYFLVSGIPMRLK
ncbi:MAG: bifunctional adenosylcobinamide kinase/adenosylcobinamide-phosphate guanylyltransferase [Deltaproteobacteria bacterium]|nr:bifunctional adenosylcobinamide kinase/adenosylcobinamide-phosphate guanylyltransferase [Deltaproteobacteria bacterium]